MLFTASVRSGRRGPFPDGAGNLAARAPRRKRVRASGGPGRRHGAEAVRRVGRDDMARLVAAQQRLAPDRRDQRRARVIGQGIDPGVTGRRRVRPRRLRQSRARRASIASGDACSNTAISVCTPSFSKVQPGGSRPLGFIRRGQKKGPPKRPFSSNATGRSDYFASGAHFDGFILPTAASKASFVEGLRLGRPARMPTEMPKIR